jgi:hypothetical protein
MTAQRAAMAPAFPIWALPFVLALLGIAVALGNFSTSVDAFAVALTLCAVGYSYVVPRLRPTGGAPVANLLALLPGHLLLLFGLGTLPRPDALGLVWGALPIGSVVYDWVSSRGPFGGRTSILAGLYAIIWLVVFFLLERFIVDGKGITGHAAIVTAVAFGAIGVVFVVTGTIRHRRAVKE